MCFMLRFWQAVVNAKITSCLPQLMWFLGPLPSSAELYFMVTGLLTLLTLWWDTETVRHTHMWRGCYPIAPSRYFTRICWVCRTFLLFWGEKEKVFISHISYISFFWLEKFISPSDFLCVNWSTLCCGGGKCFTWILLICLASSHISGESVVAFTLLRLSDGQILLCIKILNLTRHKYIMLLLFCNNLLSLRCFSLMGKCILDIILKRNRSIYSSIA